MGGGCVDLTIQWLLPNVCGCQISSWIIASLLTGDDTGIHNVGHIELIFTVFVAEYV
jgi:hypothetical protein